MRVGIFGGTFDPVHHGHLRAAEEIRESFSLDRVYFVPVFVPPHKTNRRISDVKDRLAMVRLGIKGNSLFKLSDVEVKRGGISYSIDTLCVMEKRSEELYYLIGLDAFLELHTWHRYTDLFHHTNFVVMVRPGRERRTGLRMFPAKVRKQIKPLGDGVYQHVSGKKIYVRLVTQLDISATNIRKSVGEGRSIRYLVPATVEKYIDERKLYQGVH